MKLKFVATPRDVMIFAVFALFLLYVVCIGVLNIPVLAATGTFYGLNPIEAFSPDYIYYTLIIYFIALGGLIMSVNSYFFEFQEGFGIKISESSGGGYSSWAKPKDIKEDNGVKKILASDSKVDAAGTPLISNGKELWVDNGEYHTLVIGATGSGKTQNTILPTIKVLAKKGESVVVTDPKGEIYEKAGGLLKKNGYKIILLNFRNPQNGNTWNPLELPYRLYKNGNQDKAIELLDDLALLLTCSALQLFSKTSRLSIKVNLLKKLLYSLSTHSNSRRFDFASFYLRKNISIFLLCQYISFLKVCITRINYYICREIKNSFKLTG